MRLKELREEKKITQKEVAEAIGGTQSNLAKWEKEKIQPAADMIIKLADFFGVSADYLLGRTDDFGNAVASLPALSEDENGLLALYRGMTRAQKARFLSYGEGLLGTDTPTKFKS
jgi:transcriptional regulator with XRE-family HTH domain